MNNKELITALFNIQKELYDNKITKDSTANAGKFSFEYASLPALLDVIVPLCHKYNLKLKQDIDIKDGKEVIATIITHVITGAEDVSYVKVEDDWEDIKDWGAQTTYKKRYALMGAFGIFPDKDTSETHHVKRYSDTISDAQLKFLKQLLQNNPQKEADLLDTYGKLEEIPKREASDLITKLKGGA